MLRDDAADDGDHLERFVRGVPRTFQEEPVDREFADILGPGSEVVDGERSIGGVAVILNAMDIAVEEGKTPLHVHGHVNLQTCSPGFTKGEDEAWLRIAFTTADKLKRSDVFDRQIWEEA